MSYDLAVWYPSSRLSDEEALQQYQSLCDENVSGLEPHSSIEAFIWNFQAFTQKLMMFQKIKLKILISAPGVLLMTFLIVTS